MLLLATVTTFEIIAICAIAVMAGVVFGFALCAILSAGSRADDAIESILHERDAERSALTPNS